MARAQVLVRFHDLAVEGDGAEPADIAVHAGVVVVIEDVAVGIGHARQPALACAGVIVTVLHAGRRRGDSAAMFLVLGGEIALAVKGPLHLVDDVAVDIVAGVEIREAVGVGSICGNDGTILGRSIMSARSLVNCHRHRQGSSHSA